MPAPAAARLAAALVALALTGLPRLAAVHAPAAGHACTCPARAEHRCACALCRRAALAARATGAARPCCREGARKELAAERGAPGAPCAEGTCGDGARPPVTFAGVEPFFPPPAPVLPLALRDEPLRRGPARAGTRSLEPETPPPRRA